MPIGKQSDAYRAGRRPASALDAGVAARRLLLLATLATVALWFVPYSQYLLYPLRLFVTFVHESGHALTAIATGGSVESLHVSPNGSGYTLVRDSTLWAWLTLSGGYLGTTGFGAVMLQAARLGKSRQRGRIALQIMAVYILGVTLLWGAHLVSDPFTLVTGIVLAIALFVAARVLSPAFTDFLAAFLAVQCCLNALGDLRILFYYTANNLGDNDAKFMSDAYGLPPTFWALIWVGIALLILAFSLRSYWLATGSRTRRQAIRSGAA